MTAPAQPTLTDRELYVLLRSAAGDTYAVIAKDLQMHELAVGKLASRMFVKLGARNIANAVLLGCHAGLIDGRRQHHGDHNGYTAHLRRGDAICDPCREGEKAYRDGLKAARQGQQRSSAPVSRPRGARLDSATSDPSTGAQAPAEPRSHPNAA